MGSHLSDRAAACRRKLGVGTIFIGLLVCALPSGSAFAAPAQPDLSAWTANDDVLSIARHGDITYIGGEFKYVGPRTGSGLPFSAADASLLPFPEVSGGGVSAVEPDGAGGWFIGGRFTHVGTQPRAGLAHVLSNGSVDPGFDPAPNNEVRDIEVSPDGTKLYAAGSFTQIGGQLRNRIAALTPSTGAVQAWNPNADSGVYELAVHPTLPYIYAGGQFGNIGGATRSYFAEINTNSGLATGAYTLANNNPVTAIEVSADGSAIYVGGSFSQFQGAPREAVAKLDFTPPALSSWNPSATRTGSCGCISDLALGGGDSTVYLAGFFDTVAGMNRPHFAAVGAATGTPTSWNPAASGDLSGGGSDGTAITVDGSTVYVGGEFTSVGGQPRNGLAAIDAAGNATAWHGNVSGRVDDIEVAGGTVYAGGGFTAAKGVLRRGLAALDSSGVATAWNPGTGGYGSVYSLAVSSDGQVVYAGGNFTAVGGQPRDNIAAVSAAGAATSFNPGADSDVLALALSPDGSTLFAGGDFSSAGAQPRANLASFATATGAVTGWDPAPDSAVEALLPKPGAVTILVGGQFSNAGGAPRDSVAEIDIASGVATGWNPDPNGDVHALALSPDGSTVYLGGNFSNVGPDVRNNIAAVSAASGAATAWNPDADSDVHALTLPPGGATVFAGGDFTGPGAIGGADREHLAELDATTGAATAWNPAPDSEVLALLASGPDLFAGGNFRAVGTRAHRGFAQFTVPRPAPVPTPPDTTPPTISSLSLTNSVFAVGRAPTPLAAVSQRRVRRGTTFRYTLSEAAKVTIAFKRELPGLRVGGRCRLATAALTRRVLRQLAPRVRNLTGRARAQRLRALLRRRACTVLRSRGKLTRNAVLGRNSTKFSGRVGRRALALGRYRAIFTAVDGAGNRSAPPKRLRFRVVRAPRRP